jgi:hypothetical protein
VDLAAVKRSCYSDMALEKNSEDFGIARKRDGSSPKLGGDT